MYNSKLIDILKALSTEEKEGLRKWINSPAHNHREDRKKLFNYLLDKRKLTIKTTNRHIIFKYIYTNSSYDDKRLKRLMNLSIQLLENFIHFWMHKKNTFSKQKAIILFLNQHSLDKYITQYIRKTQSKQQENPIQSSDYYNQAFQLEELIFEQNNNLRPKETNLQTIFNYRYLSFVLDTLRYACAAVTHQRLYKTDYHIPLLDAILKEIEVGKYQDTPTVQLYYNSYKALTCPEEEQYFEQLKKLLVGYYDKLSHKEIKDIYLIAINYCVKKLNDGIESYVRAAFDLYQYGLKHNILIENNILSHFAYKNIIAIAIRLEEYNWTQQFINLYTQQLMPIYQETYGHYAKAKLAFAKKDFDTTLLLLLQVEFDNLFLNMDTKVMLLKIYYERNDFDALEALLNSFRRFLQRKQILAYQRQIHGNMIQLTTKLLNTPSYNKAKIEALRTEIQATHPLTEKLWLLEQLDKLT